MSDCEEGDFFWESLISPGKRKRKKNKKCVKHKNNITVKNDESIQKKKKKKNSKFKEEMEGRKEKKREKKRKWSLGLSDSSVFIQGYSGASGPTVKSKPESSQPCSTEKLKADHLTQDLKKKTKRKKKVVFDLSPGFIHVKRPKFVSSSPQENILSEKQAVRDSESCSQVTVTEHNQGQSHDNDTQCTSDDINSQDLFITQRMFRTSLSEPSSDQASDKAVITTPPPITPPEGGLHPSGAQIKHEGSDTHVQDSHLHQHHKTAKDHLQRPKTIQIVLTEEEEWLHPAQQSSKNETLSFQKQMELNTNLVEEKKVPTLIHVNSVVVNPYLDDPFVVKPSLNIAKSKTHSYTSSQHSPSCLLNTDETSLLPYRSKATISTQTENFFTTELSSYLSFCQKSRVTACFENLKPLDLSLPQRARTDEEKHSNQKLLSLPDKIKGNGHKDPSLHPSCSTDIKDVEVKKEPKERSVSAQNKGKTTPSPQSESELKSVDTTTSSEDNEPHCCTGKLDLAQVIPHSPLPTIHCGYTDPYSHQISVIFVNFVSHNLQ